MCFVLVQGLCNEGNCVWEVALNPGSPFEIIFSWQSQIKVLGLMLSEEYELYNDNFKSPLTTLISSCLILWNEVMISWWYKLLVHLLYLNKQCFVPLCVAWEWKQFDVMSSPSSLSLSCSPVLWVWRASWLVYSSLCSSMLWSSPGSSCMFIASLHGGGGGGECGRDNFCAGKPGFEVTVLLPKLWNSQSLLASSSPFLF